MKLAILGLGKMGSRIAEKLLRDGHDVVIWNRSEEPVAAIKGRYPDVTIAHVIEELKDLLEQPRIIWLMLPAGEATENILSHVQKIVDPKDIVIDGGNAHFSETEKRCNDFEKMGVRFLGIGVSGGIIAVTNGYPLMIGGSESAYQEIKPILDSLAKPNGGYHYFGKGGAGHFVKMVHNGIEYGIMQSLGEGFGILEKSQYSFNLLDVAKLYQKGTLVSGFMLDRAVEALTQDETLSHVEGIIDASGEAQWTIDEAKKEDVPVEVIEKSLAFRNKSKTDKKIQQSFAAKLVAALRNAFGGHEVKRK
ncbi:MAG: phosphogluconate dehydrogenase (NAD(+)-dependent, decarboxylating) [Candidatus Levyibacteriota bacterium]